MIQNVNVHQELGEIKVGVKQTIRFEIPKSLAIRDVNLATSCGCTGAKYVNSEQERYIAVSYTPSPVPHHLKGQGFYETFKSVTALLHMINGPTEELKLTFQATIKP